MDRDTLQECAPGDEVLNEVCRYLENPYSETSPEEKPKFPLQDEPHVLAWESYAAQAMEQGAVAVLRDKFVQLRFPVEEGISQTEVYRLATKRGRFEAAERYADGVVFAEPGSVTVGVYSTIAGRVPVILAGQRADFEALVRAFSSRNEPEPVPASMGACIVTGFNNWDRVRSYRRNWERALGREASEEEWQQEFREAVIPNKRLYQDRFIILSSGYYSDCSAESLGADAEGWQARSIAIRREHEFTHYFTHRVFSQMRNHLHDEVIADFVGLARATGAYDEVLAARFFGLESYPEYRAGGRFENYLGSPPVSPAASKVLQCVVHRSIQNLGAFARGRLEQLTDLNYLCELVFVLAHLGLDALAATDAVSVIEARLGEGG